MTHASLFSGIGGPEVAATMLGWDNLFHCEINEFGRTILNYWFPNSKSYEDITKTDFTGWRGKVDVLSGGFPCQPFSYAGQRRGADDDRYLWPHMFRCIDEIRPSWVVAENVAGVTTMVEQGEVSEVGGQASMFEEVDDIHRYRYSATFTLERICRDLESHGYQVQPVLVPACAVGAPHRRDRVFIIARRNDAVADTNEGSCGTSPDTESEQGGRCELGQPRCCKPQQVEPGGICGKDAAKRNAADTYGKRPDKPNPATQPSKPQRFDCKEDYKRRIAGFGRWDSFPTVSPVHRGNDGIPFDVDRLSIPFSKWRTESIKAYGNAIVPQVMYEIFRAIEITEKGAAPSTRQ